MKIPVNQVIVGERVREDTGDIKALADSIAKYGLLHPIVLDDDNNLVAGGRRLEAIKLLGWENISFNNIGKLSDIKLREIELEENLRRKDLTEYEKSKDMVELARLRAEELRKEFLPIVGEKGFQISEKATESNNEFRANVAQNLNNEFCPTIGRNLGGRPANPNSIRKMAKSIGVAPKTLHDSFKHVEAVEKYPKLIELPKMKAIEASKKLDKLPESARDELLEKEYQELCKFQDFALKTANTYIDQIGAISRIKIDDESLNAWPEHLNRNDIECHLKNINEGINRLIKLKEFLQSLNKLRVVKK